MEKVKEKVLSRLSKLRRIEYPQPTAMDLHGPRPLLGRVQRQEDRLYKQRVLEQQKKFKLKLQKIEKYYADVQAERQRRLDLLAEWKRSEEPYERPIFQPISMVVPKPVIGIPRAPLQRRVRLQPRGRLRKLKRLR